jgi:hypothetical protein
LEIVEGWMGRERREGEQEDQSGEAAEHEDTPAELLDSLLQQLANAALMVG